MKLTVKDRLNFEPLFLKEGNLITQILVKGIFEKVTLTSDEINEINLRQTGNPMQPQLQWDTDKAKDKEITFNNAELTFLKEQVERINNQEKVNQDNVNLCLIIQAEKLTEK